MTTLFDDTDLETVEETRDLPELSGTEKQVKWARHVRARKLDEIDALLKEWALLCERYEGLGRTERAGLEREARAAAIDAPEGIEGRTYAGWWLDRRSLTARELLAGAPPKEDDRLK